MKTLATLTALIILGAFPLLSQKTTPCDNLPDNEVGDSIVLTSKNYFKDVYHLNSDYVKFDKTQLEELYKKDEDTYVRIYMVMPKDSTFPCLPRLLLTTFKKSECQIDSVTNMILSSSKDQGSRDTTLTPEITAALSNWRNLYEEGGALAGFVPIYGYNHTWKWIKDARKSTDLIVFFALRDTTYNKIDTVYVDLYMTDSTIPTTSNKVFIDFALPCPKLCGQLGVARSEEEIENK